MERRNIGLDDQLRIGAAETKGVDACQQPAIAIGYGLHGTDEDPVGEQLAQLRAEIDALAIRRGGGKFAVLDRVSVQFPPTNNNRIGTSYTSACGSLVRVEIERATGASTSSPEGSTT